MRLTMSAAAAALLALTGAAGHASAQPAGSYEQSHPYDHTRPPVQGSGQTLQRGGDEQMRRAELGRREDQFRRDEAARRERHPRHAVSTSHHRGWKRGEQMSRAAWNQQKPVDWRNHQLSAPARGYEWRHVDNDYVLARSSNRRVTLVVRADH